MKKVDTKRLRKKRRETRVRKKILGHSSLPRLSVFRSNRYFYAQIIDDKSGKTLLCAAERELKSMHAFPGLQRAEAVGKLLADKAKKKGVLKVVFDRGAYKYQGRVKSFAQGARAAGLEF